MSHQRIPIAILQKLTPIAAKLYLLLESLAVAEKSPQNPIPLVRTDIPTLAAHAATSLRTCHRAMAQLRALSLIQRLPRHYQQPNTYLLPFAAQINLPPVADLLNTSKPPNPAHLPPMSPCSTQKPAAAPPQPRSTPIPAPKYSSLPPMAVLLNIHDAIEKAAITGTASEPLRQLISKLQTLPLSDPIIQALGQIKARRALARSPNLPIDQGQHRASQAPPFLDSPAPATDNLSFTPVARMPA